MLVVFIRAIILFIIVFVTMRLMGKRELSQIQPFEFVIILLMADLASGPMSDRNMTTFHGIIPILALLIMYMFLTFLLKTNKKVQDTICGTPILLIEDGIINEKEMKKQEYMIEDIMSQIRSKGIFKIQDVAYAILETNGNLSIIRKDEKEGDNIPLNVISDGKRLENNLEILNITIGEFEQILQKNNVKEEDILIGTVDEHRKFIYQLKAPEEETK